jgi:gliding motility-associated-like protein
MPNSTFHWVINGASKINMTPAGDTVDITWTNTPGYYSIGISEVSDFGCIGDTVYSVVNVQGAIVDLGPDVKICQGDSATFDAGTGWDSVTWKDGSHFREYTTNKSDTVWVTVTTTSGCKNSDTAILYVNPKPHIDLERDTTVCGSELLNLNAGNDGIIYQWSNGEITPSFIITTDSFGNNEQKKFYWVKVTNSEGCSSTDTINISKCNLTSNDIPIAFTPNGDAHNDTWEINFLKYYSEATVEVYDRWGRLVFYSKGYSKPWDGTSDNKRLPIDSYFYVINLHNGSQPFYGTVTILR